MLTGAVYVPIVSAEEPLVEARKYALALMWSPAIAAIVTRLIFQRNLREMGWGWGKTRYQLLGYFLPVITLCVVYVPLWTTGLAEFSSEYLTTRIARTAGSDVPFSLGLTLLIQATVGVLTCFIPALGEEIGWRGFLVPELAKRTTFTNTALVSGAIWAVWHYPLFLVGFAEDVPVVQAIVCHTAVSFALAFIMAWIRLKSGSLWTCAIMHACSNLYLEGVFEDVTVDNSLTRLVADDFGYGVALVYVLVAFLFWLKRSALPQVKDPVGSENSSETQDPLPVG